VYLDFGYILGAASGILLLSLSDWNIELLLVWNFSMDLLPSD